MNKREDTTQLLSEHGSAHGLPARRDVLRLTVALGALAVPGALGATSAKAAISSDALRPFPGQNVARLPLTEKQVALTFDCGSNPHGVDKILKTLAEHSLPATFFMTGGFASTHPDAARRIATRHRVGNHSMTHPDFTKLTHDQRVREVRSAADAISKAIGRRPAPLFRFPYGYANRACIADVNAEGYACVYWTVDTRGWRGASRGATTDTVIRRVMAALTPGAIILMHAGRASPTDPSTVDATALPRLIKAINDHGYGYTTLNTLMP